MQGVQCVQCPCIILYLRLREVAFLFRRISIGSMWGRVQPLTQTPLKHFGTLKGGWGWA